MLPYLARLVFYAHGGKNANFILIVLGLSGPDMRFKPLHLGSTPVRNTLSYRCLIVEEVDSEEVAVGMCEKHSLIMPVLFTVSSICIVKFRLKANKYSEKSPCSFITS